MTAPEVREEGRDGERVLDGERGPAALGRGTPLQSKIRSGLAAAVVIAVGGGFLGWYYLSLAEHRAVAATPPAAATADVRLPPIGPAPEVPVKPVEEPLSGESEFSSWSGEVPESDGVAVAAVDDGADSAVETSQARRLGSPVRVKVSVGAEAAPVEATAGDAALDGPQGRPEPVGSAGAEAGLGAMLRPTVTPATAAGLLPDRRFLLPKGAFIDCTLETAIDSTLPGMTTCITATDVWSADGSVVLIERGSKLVGETRSGLAQGQQRVFVLWSEARTPNGVTVGLDSPGTDALGRSGVTGEVDTHFWARFGAAMLISLIDAGAAAVVAAQGSGQGTVVITPQGSSEVLGEVLRSTVNIPPTVRVPQGARIAVLVARDVSFARVYALRSR